MWHASGILTTLYQNKARKRLKDINTVNVFLFVDTNFRGLWENDRFVDSWIRGFDNFIKQTNVKFYFCWKPNFVVYQPMKYTKIGTTRTKIHSQYLCSSLIHENWLPRIKVLLQYYTLNEYCTHSIIRMEEYTTSYIMTSRF